MHAVLCFTFSARMFIAKLCLLVLYEKPYSICSSPLTKLYKSPTAQQKPVIATLTRLFNETSEALGGSRANPAKKREIEDNSKKLGALFAKLNSGDISKNAAEKLVQLCQALDNGDFATALQIQVQEKISNSYIFSRFLIYSPQFRLMPFHVNNVV